MGLLFQDKGNLKEDVENQFGKDRPYLLAMKHNGPGKSALKLALSNLYYTFDSNRTFVLVFDHKGIYEKEISNGDKGNFYLMPESELEDFTVEEKPNKALIHFKHIGKEVSYEIPFSGRLFKNNQENFNRLVENHWERL